MFRAGLRMLMTTICPGATALEAATIAEALALLAEHPDAQLCLLDLSFKNEGGLSGLTHIDEAATETAVVVISGAEDNATIHACLDAGAMSFIPKSLGPDVLTQALHQVLQGKVYLPEQLVRAVSDMPPRPALTSRQLQVLQ